MKECVRCKKSKPDKEFIGGYCSECKGEHYEKYGRKLICFIYVVINPAWPSYVKIGRTNDIKRRLEIYQTHSPLRDYEAYYLKKVSNIRDLERYFKSNFNSTANGEWVQIDKDKAVELIEELGRLDEN